MPDDVPYDQPFKPTRKVPERGLTALSVHDIPLPERFHTKLPAQIIQIIPGGWGGNHRHLSREVYVGFGDGLYIVWRDKQGKRHEKRMTSNDGKMHAISMPPFVPHMVENRSQHTALLYELRELNGGPVEMLEGAESLR